MPFSELHPTVGAWCAQALVEPTPPQRDALPLGQARRNVLVCSPTGTGKTLAAFLPVFSSLAARRDADELHARTYALYVSPLRALGYDVEHNVRRPLREMGLLERPNTERAQKRRGRLRERFVRTGVRTGDTPVEERRLMMSRPPHILMTTPESLAVMLAMESYRKGLRTVETVVVDELHALAGNKRGTQLSLLLESLEELVDAPFNRIGLSATIAPLDRVAHFLTGGEPGERACEIVDHRGLRSIHIGIHAPFSGAVAQLPTIARAVVERLDDVRTALVFCNVRSQAERVAHEMSLLTSENVERVDGEAAPKQYDLRIGIHHSALERSLRHRVEGALRNGDLRAVVCSSSLELGVDIGYVDRVLIVGGARGITATLQRIGRAGHRPGATAQGVIVAQDRDDIIEAAATRRCIADGVIEEVVVPQAPLDVLAQWLVGSVCYDKRFSIDDAWRIARRAFPFRELAREDLVACARYLSGGGAGPQEAHVRRLGFDGDAVFGLGRDACAPFFENVGTIPDESQVVVRGAGMGDLGRVEEGFVSDLAVGDAFLLNGRSLRVKEIGRNGVIVEPHTGRPTVPQWSSHLKGVSPPLAREITALRTGVAQCLRRRDARAAHAFLKSRYSLEGTLAAHVVRYIAQQLALSDVPGEGNPIVEIYRMDRAETAVFHTCAGRRVNETLARIAGARVFALAKLNTKLVTDDNGFLIALPAGKHIPDATWASLLSPRRFGRDLREGLRTSNMVRSMFRYVANAGLLVLRRAGGRSVARRRLSWNSARIYDRLVRADPQFPLLRETYRVVTRDLLDAPAAKMYLDALAGEPRVLHPPAATPFSFGIVTSSFADSVVLDDRTSMVEALHERVMQILGEQNLPDEADGEAIGGDVRLPLRWA